MTTTRRTLSVQRLSTGYRGHNVIRELSLDSLHAGQVTALVGPNAAGKSTLLRAIAGLLPISGTVRLDDVDLASLSPVERAGHVSFMPQSLPLGVGLSILESVLSALLAMPSDLPGARDRDDARERALRALDRVGILDAALQPLDQLSGGQRQLASLAQSIVRDPHVLLLDEPTSALDLRHQVLVMRMVRRLADDGAIVLVVLHDLNLAARWADHVVVLHDGQVHVAGTPAVAITPTVLADVYGVAARVEACSHGRLQVIVDDAP